MPIQEVNRAYFVSRYFIGLKGFRNIFSLFCATHGHSISYREAFSAGGLNKNKKNISFNKNTVILANLSKNKHEKYTSELSRTLLMTIFFLIFFGKGGDGGGGGGVE